MLVSTTSYKKIGSVGKDLFYDMPLIKTFQCLILSRKNCRVGPGKIGLVGVAETSNLFFLSSKRNFSVALILAFEAFLKVPFASA